MVKFLINGQTFNDLSSIRNKKIVIFPGGRLSEMILQYHVVSNVFCICDNSSSKLDTTINGIPVVSPESLVGLEGELCILVTSPTILSDIFVQLGALNIFDRCEFVICIWDWHTAKKFYDPFTFEDRRKNNSKLLLVLAGYKEKLWEIVFKRIARFLPDGIDVCVMSAGKYLEKLSKICALNNWSYLSTEMNNLACIQNIAIKLHANAEYIYKLDEDMFICKGFFEGLLETYEHVENNSRYHVGIVAPIIPVNPHGSIRFLEKAGLLDRYEKKFGKAYYDFFTHFYTKTAETLFLWKHSLPLDEMAEKFRAMPFSYFVCPHRFSIGAILFKRATWEKMKGFEVRHGVGLGDDEYQFAHFFLANVEFNTFIMAENILAGHFSFGQVDDPNLIYRYFNNNRALFDISNSVDGNKPMLSFPQFDIGKFQ